MRHITRICSSARTKSTVHKNNHSAIVSCHALHSPWPLHHFPVLFFIYLPCLKQPEDRGKQETFALLLQPHPSPNENWHRWWWRLLSHSDNSSFFSCSLSNYRGFSLHLPWSIKSKISKFETNRIRTCILQVRRTSFMSVRICKYNYLYLSR